MMSQYFILQIQLNKTSRALRFKCCWFWKLTCADSWWSFPRAALMVWRVQMKYVLWRFCSELCACPGDVVCKGGAEVFCNRVPEMMSVLLDLNAKARAVSKACLTNEPKTCASSTSRDETPPPWASLKTAGLSKNCGAYYTAKLSQESCGTLRVLRIYQFFCNIKVNSNGVRYF